MSDTTPILGLPYILPSQAQKHVTHNEAIDALVQLTVESQTTTTPPAAPSDGQRFIVAAGSSGDWAGHAADVAIWRDGYWTFYTPRAGWQAHIVDEMATSIFDSVSWEAPLLNLQNLPHVGLNAVADTANRLTSAAQGTLLTHDGAGHQLAVNKASGSDTASVVFQNNFSGRAEVELVGDNDLSIKVSADGTSFQSALAIQAASAITTATGLNSGTLTIASDTVADITPPSISGFILILNVGNDSNDLNVPRVNHSGVFVFDCGTTPNSAAIFVGSSLEDQGTSAMTGTTSASNKTGVSVQEGKISIENRANADRTYSYTFLGSV